MKGRPRVQPDPEINRLYLEGLSLAEIGRRLHMSDMAVLRRLRRAGVKTRPRGRRREPS